MKKAINQWCFPADWSWERVFALCEAERFRGIELCVDYPPFFEAMAATPQEGLVAEIARSVGSRFVPSKALRFDSPEADARAVARMAEDHGLRFSSLLTIAQFHYSLVHEDPAIRRTGIDLVRRLIDLAAIVGAPAVLVVPGVVTPWIRYDEACERLVDAMGELARDAERKGVRLGIENVWGKLLYSPIEMRDLVDRLASPAVGVHFDVGNVLRHGYPEQWIRILGKRIVNVHLKDYLEGVDTIRGFTHLFQGDVPWARVMEALREVGYEGYLIAEVPPYPFCPEEGIRDISRKIDILTGLG